MLHRLESPVWGLQGAQKLINNRFTSFCKQIWCVQEQGLNHRHFRSRFRLKFSCFHKCSNLLPKQPKIERTSLDLPRNKESTYESPSLYLETSRTYEFLLYLETPELHRDLVKTLEQTHPALIYSESHPTST